MEIKARSKPFINRTVRFNQKVVLLLQSVTLVFIKLRGKPILLNKDYIFHPKPFTLDIGIESGFSVIITDYYIVTVEIRNTSISPVILPKGFLFGHIKDLNKQGCYIVSPAKLKSWIRSAIKVAVGIIITAASYYLSVNEDDRYIEILATLPEILERIIPLSVTIYG